MIFLHIMPCHAQLLYANWPLGHGRSMSFVDAQGNLLDRPTYTNTPLLHSLEASAAISDPCTGRLIAYSYGKDLRDNVHNVIWGGDSLASGESSHQGVVMLPYPGKPNLVAVFTAPELTSNAGKPLKIGGNYAYSIIDVSKRNGSGEVIASNIPLPTIANGSESIAVTSDADGKGFWIMTLHPTSTSYAVHTFHFDTTGVNLTPVISPDIKCSNPKVPYLYSVFSSDGKLLAMSDANTYMHIYDFDATTGKVSFRATMDVQAWATRQYPDAKWSFAGSSSEFSPSGRWLYASCAHGKPSGTRVEIHLQILQIDMQTLDLASSTRVIYDTITTSVNIFGAPIRLAPNGKIYFNDRATIASIEQPDIAAPGCNVQRSILTLPNEEPVLFPIVAANTYTISYTPGGSVYTPPTIAVAVQVGTRVNLEVNAGSGVNPNTTFTARYPRNVFHIDNVHLSHLESSRIDGNDEVVTFTSTTDQIPIAILSGLVYLSGDSSITVTIEATDINNCGTDYKADIAIAARGCGLQYRTVQFTDQTVTITRTGSSILVDIPSSHLASWASATVVITDITGKELSRSMAQAGENNIYIEIPHGVAFIHVYAGSSLLATALMSPQ